MDTPRPSWYADSFARLLAGDDLDPAHTADLFRDLLAGRVDDVSAAGLLTALRMKGESAAEIAAAARALREQMTRLVPVSGPVLDTCGTGGDGSGTGIDLTEAVQLLRLLESLGVKLVCVSGGNPYSNPHLLRPALFPPSDGYHPPEDPLVGVARQLDVTAKLKAKLGTNDA